MNNFEKRKMLDYLIKLLPVTDTNDYSFDAVFDFLCLEFNINRKPYPIDKDNCLELNTQKQKEHFIRCTAVKIPHVQISTTNTANRTPLNPYCKTCSNPFNICYRNVWIYPNFHSVDIPHLQYKGAVLFRYIHA